MAEGFVFFAAVLAQGFLCAKLLPRKYNDMEKGILVGAAEIAEIAVAANLLAVFGIFSLYALSAILLFSVPHTSATIQFLYIFVTYNFCTTVCYTAINLPYGSLSAMMTRDSKQRDLLSVFRMGLSPMGRIIAVTCTMPLIKLFGDDLNRMFSLGNEIKNSIQDIPGIADLNVEQQIERPQLIISPKREVLAKYGISLPEFSEFVNVCLAGESVSQVYEKGKSFDLTVRVKDDLRDEMEKIRNLMIDTGNGQKIPLNYVADIRSAMGPNTISRENVKRKIVISANVADRDLRSVVNDIQERVDKQIKLPEGYHIEYGGQFESEQAASRTLALTSFMSVVVIFLLLYHEFRSVKESAIILINLPLALIGGVFALLITTGEISIPAIIGFISLFGIATRNGMLLISHYNHLQKEEGYGVYDSVIRGSLDRLNPILMTALSSALALIPLALSGDLPGNEIQSPMAKVILGGLLTSTFLNGFIIPIVYLMMHGKKKVTNE